MRRDFWTRQGIGLLITAGLLLAGRIAEAQGWGDSSRQPEQPPVYRTPQAVEPSQPVVPQDPRLERRPPAPQGPWQGGVQGPVQGPMNPPPSGANPSYLLRPGVPGPRPAQPPAPQVPFVLTPNEMAELDRVLAAWEQRNKEIRSFECKFTLWTYDSVFGDGTGRQPKTTDQGEIKYAAPDKGLYRIQGERQVQWLCDGKSMFQWIYDQKQVKEYPLPPELQGKGIANGPLPFVFGTEASRLKQRYFLRIITPRDAQGEVWIEAFPRYQADASEFKRAELILKTTGFLPDAIQLIDTNGRDRRVYKFDDVVINRRFIILERDWTHVSIPFGWQKVVDAPPQAQTARPPAYRR